MIKFLNFFFGGTILDHTAIEARATLLMVPLNILAQQKVNHGKERKKNGGRSSTWGKSKGKNIFGVGGVGIVALCNQWLQKFIKKISLCSGDQKEETLLGMCRDSTTQEQKAKLSDKRMCKV